MEFYIRRFSIINAQLYQYNLGAPIYVDNNEEFQSFIALIDLLEKLKVTKPYLLGI